MPATKSFNYAIVRVVPLVEREEFVNAGVILFCRECPFLGARIALDRTRLAALAPWLDLVEVERQLALIPAICAGEPAAGDVAALSPAERFHWLVAPRSTVIQTSPVRMFPRWFRLLVAAATALCAWVVATPARAAAPMCDQRGATVFAPAPQLQPIQTSLDIAPPESADESDCFARLAHATSASGSHAPQAPAASVTGDPAIPSFAHGVIDPAWVPAPDVVDATNDAREGVHLRVERPPRG